MWAMQYLLCDRPRSFITSGGLGHDGLRLPGRRRREGRAPDATVVCVDGDGCFQMTSQELATSVTEDLPIVVVIVNNGYLGMVRQWQDMFFEERFSQVRLDSGSPDYVKLAEAYGAVGLRVRVRGRARRPRSPSARLRPHAVVDCRVDPGRALLPDDPAGAAALDLVEYEDRRVGADHVIHTLSVLVGGQAGRADAHLEHVRARGYNIESLAVGPTERRTSLAHRDAGRLLPALASSRSRSRCTSSSTSSASASSSRGRRSSASCA
jgi:hypothetical protein